MLTIKIISTEALKPHLYDHCNFLKNMLKQHLTLYFYLMTNMEIYFVTKYQQIVKPL